MASIPHVAYLCQGLRLDDLLGRNIGNELTLVPLHNANGRTRLGVPHFPRGLRVSHFQLLSLSVYIYTLHHTGQFVNSYRGCF